MRINFKKKSTIFLAAGLLTAIFIVPLFLKIIIHIRINDSEIKGKVTEFYKNSINRAVKFDEASIDFRGNIILKNFELAASRDFNDNLSLLKAKEAIIKLSLFQLVAGDIIVKEAVFESPEINIIKKFEKGYGDFIEDFVKIAEGFRNSKNFSRPFLLCVKNGVIYYRDFLSSSRVLVEVTDSFLDIESDAVLTEYNFSGQVKPFKIKSAKSGKFRMKGFYDAKKSKIRNNIRLDSVDISYINDYIFGDRKEADSINGLLSSNITFEKNAGDFAVKGSIEAGNINYVNGITSHNILSKENLNLDIDFHSSNGFKNLFLDKLLIGDDVADITVSGKYINDKEETAKISISTNKINLKKLSVSVSPVKDIVMDGTFEVKADIEYDKKKNNLDKSRALLKLKKFGVSKISDGKTRKVISETDVDMELKGADMTTKAGINSGKSDFSLNAVTKISSLIPFKSDSKITVLSKTVTIGLIKNCAAYIMNIVYGEAYKDAKKGWEDIFFLQKPVSAAIINNNIEMDVKASNFELSEGKNFQNLSFVSSLNAGTFYTKEFRLNGFDSVCSLDVTGYFNRDYPWINIKGAVSGLDLGKFFLGRSPDDSEKPMWGKLNLDFSYEVGVYRFSQILENSKGEFNLTAGKFRIKNSEVQTNIDGLLKKCGYERVNLSDLSIGSLNISISQTAENIYLKSLSLSSDMANLSSYGSYNYLTGLNIVSNLSFATGDGSTATVPLNIRKTIAAPEVELIFNKEIKKVPLFNVD